VTTGDSRPVTSTQAGLHPRLDAVVARHLAAPARGPVPAHTRAAFEVVAARVAAAPGRALMLDAGCGTAESTARIARAHPRHWVIGIDQSAVRLATVIEGRRPLPHNAIVVRAEIAAFWRLARAAGMRFERLWLLYPNPWPKPAQLMRRWHAHPAFADALAVAATIELRTNWRLYADEMQRALTIAGWTAVVEPWGAPDPTAADAVTTPFETKYAGSGHALWRLVAADPGPRAEAAAGHD
jgi:tRNA G46 methylase TrmB